jgi:hypothetical protein
MRTLHGALVSTVFVSGFAQTHRHFPRATHVAERAAGRVFGKAVCAFVHRGAVCSAVRSFKRHGEMGKHTTLAQRDCRGYFATNASAVLCRQS